MGTARAHWLTPLENPKHVDPRFLFQVVRRHPVVVLLCLMIGVGAQLMFALTTEPEYSVSYLGVARASAVNVLISADDVVDNPRSPWRVSDITANTIMDTLVREVKSEQGAQLLAAASIQQDEVVEIDVVDGFLVVNTYAPDPAQAVAANRAVVSYLKDVLLTRQDEADVPRQAWYVISDVDLPAVAERDDGDKLRSMVGALSLSTVVGIGFAYLLEGWRQRQSLAAYVEGPAAQRKVSV